MVAAGCSMLQDSRSEQRGAQEVDVARRERERERAVSQTHSRHMTPSPRSTSSYDSEESGQKSRARGGISTRALATGKRKLRPFLLLLPASGLPAY